MDAATFMSYATPPVVQAAEVQADTPAIEYFFGALLILVESAVPIALFVLFILTCRLLWKFGS